jgi:hypothetical protein
VEPITVVSLVFGVISLAGLGLIAYLWNAYGDIQEENRRLQTEVATLLGLLERYLNAEKSTALSPARRDSLDEILFEIRQLRSQSTTTTNTTNTTNTTTIGEQAHVGQTSSGTGNEQTRKYE